MSGRSAYQDFSIAALSMWLELRLGRRVEVVSRQMRQYVLRKIAEIEELPVPISLDAALQAPAWARFADLIEGLQDLRRTADGVCVLNCDDCVQLGLGEKHLVLWAEAEHSAHLQPGHLMDYVDMWWAFDGGDSHTDWDVDVVVIDRYGGVRVLDLYFVHLVLARLRNAKRRPDGAELDGSAS